MIGESSVVAWEADTWRHVGCRERGEGDECHAVRFQVSLRFGFHEKTKKKRKKKLIMDGESTFARSLDWCLIDGELHAVDRANCSKLPKVRDCCRYRSSSLT